MFCLFFLLSRVIVEKRTKSTFSDIQPTTPDCESILQFYFSVIIYYLLLFSFLFISIKNKEFYPLIYDTYAHLFRRILPVDWPNKYETICNIYFYVISINGNKNNVKLGRKKNRNVWLAKRKYAYTNKKKRGNVRINIRRTMNVVFFLAHTHCSTERLWLCIVNSSENIDNKWKVSWTAGCSCKNIHGWYCCWIITKDESKARRDEKFTQGIFHRSAIEFKANIQ